MLYFQSPALKMTLFKNSRAFIPSCPFTLRCFTHPSQQTMKTLLSFFSSHVHMDQSIREIILCMRGFLKVHTINYFSSPKSEFWNCSFIDRWAAVTVIGNSRKHQMLWSTYQQVKGGALKHSAYWRKAFRGCREPL